MYIIGKYVLNMNEKRKIVSLETTTTNNTNTTNPTIINNTAGANKFTNNDFIASIMY